MEQCEQCGDEYEADLGECPHCGLVKLEAQAGREVRLLRNVIIASVVLLLAFILGIGLLTYAAWNRNTTLRSTTAAAGAPVASGYGAETSAWTAVNGEIIVTLTLPTSEMGDRANASHMAQGVARAIFSAIPAVSSVAVFDGDKVLIGRYRR